MRSLRAALSKLYVFFSVMLLFSIVEWACGLPLVIAVDLSLQGVES